MRSRSRRLCPRFASRLAVEGACRRGQVRAESAVVADHPRLDSATGQLNDIGDDTVCGADELDQVNELVWMRALWDEAKGIGAAVACDALKIVARRADKEDQAAAA